MREKYSNVALAEFLIDLYRKHPSLEDYQRALVENGAEFNRAFIERLYFYMRRAVEGGEGERRPTASTSTARRVPTMQEIVEEEERERRERSIRREYREPQEEDRWGRGAEVARSGRGFPSLGEGRKRRQRLSSPERFEIKQLIAAGVLNARDYTDLYEEGVAEMSTSREQTLVEPEEEVEIEISTEEPAFLRGQSSLKKVLELSPVRVVKNPEGSLARAAMSGAALAADRRDDKRSGATGAGRGRFRQSESAKDAIIKTVGASWEDPMAGTPLFADDLRRKAQTEGRSRPPVMLHNYQQLQLQQLSDSSSAPPSSRRGTPADLIAEQRRSLPIYQLKKELLSAIEDHQILIIIGDTGSGKTTQLTQYLDEAGYSRGGRIIGCTQPRRVAAMSVAKRVSEEFGCKLGEQVGYTIRFEDFTSSRTLIKYMTDGMLLRECLLDATLPAYSVIILDEAHERTIHTDVLFGLCKEAIKSRPDLKLIVTSATLEAEKFSSYFNDAPIFTIPGRTFPVEVMYTQKPETDYLDAALVTIMQIHLSEGAGDILIFLTGQEEIDTACDVLQERIASMGPAVPPLIVLPVYSALPGEMQSRIFAPAPPGCRKCVIATNIAETSITIDGIYYVVDPGFCKQKAYDPRRGMDALLVTPISQAQARQRAGRAGRTGPGKAFRLYTEQAFETEMLPSSIPEIQRTNLSNTVLALKALGINDLINFDFMDPPPTSTLLSAMHSLYALGALDGDGFLTKLGRKMAEFPLEPALSKTLLYASEVGCSEEVLTIVAMLSVTTPFYRPREQAEAADKRKSRFTHTDGDHLTLLTVYNAWRERGGDPGWCRDNFLQARTIRRADDVRKQLARIMQRYRQPISSARGDGALIRRAICSGYFTNAAKRDPHDGYKTLVDRQTVFIHPGSSLFGKSPEWVIYHELVMTSKEYMREVTIIDPRWLVDVAPAYFQLGDPRQLSKKKLAEKIVPLHNKFEGPDEWRLSKRTAQHRGRR